MAEMGKILLADDHHDIVRLLEMALRGDGHQILRAHDGVAALQLVEKERPDLVILDVNMPKLDGLRVLSRIKTDPTLCKTIVVMLTVQDQPGDVALGLDIGADYYLGKPFRPTEVQQLVRRIFENLPARDENTPRVPSSV
jgi:DNA-binding response OmpR family regulator